jgi:hypothetical protein
VCLSSCPRRTLDASITSCITVLQVYKQVYDTVWREGIFNKLNTKGNKRDVLTVNIEYDGSAISSQ